MKKITTTLLLLTLALTTASAQRGNDRENERKERIERRAKNMAENLKLDDATATWFQNLYVEYQNQLSDVRRAAMQKMPRPGKKAAEADEEDGTQMKEKEMKKLTDAEAEQAILAGFERQEKELAVKREYYKRFSEKLTPRQLVRIFVERPRAGQVRQGGRGGFPGGPGGGPGHFGPGGPGF